MKKGIIILSGIIALYITGFAQETGIIDQKEKDAILYMREEEKLARDVYDSLYAKWGVNPFGNIRYSEQVHMDRMKTLIVNYKMEDPVARNNDRPGMFVNPVLQKYYHELVNSGSKSLTEALKVGAKIEELDITDLEERIRQTQKEDIIASFEFLKMASNHHLRAFVRRLKMAGISYEPVILSTKDFDKIIALEDGKNE